MMVLDSYLTRSCPNAQYLVMMSMRVRGMVNVQSRRSERARMAMKIFLVVRRTWRNKFSRKNLGISWDWVLDLCYCLLALPDLWPKQCQCPYCWGSPGLLSKCRQLSVWWLVWSPVYNTLQTYDLKLKVLPWSFL